MALKAREGRNGMRRWIPWRRAAAGVNAAAALALAAVLGLQVNLLSARFKARFDLGRLRPFSLAAGTRALLEQLPGDLRIVVVLAADHELNAPIRALLREVAAASPRVRVETVDPVRDLARGKDLALRYDLREPNAIVLDLDGRWRIVPAGDLADYDYAPTLAGRTKVLRRFRGEPMVAFALSGLLQTRTPKVAFLTGHGERQMDDFDPQTGYSMFARLLERHAMAVQPLGLGGRDAVPADIDVLVVAGPTRRLPSPEADVIGAFLENHGRVLLLLDAGVETGLEKLLERWGVRLGLDRVAGAPAAVGQVLATAYGQHPVTAPLRNVATLFTLPRSIQPLVATNAAAGADRPRVAVLASSGESGWSEMSAHQNPPVFDPGIDLPGPVPVAVAIEKGPERAADMGLQPSRLVAIGDSLLVSNGALLAGQNADFVISALHWLVQREAPPRLDAGDPIGIPVALDGEQARQLAHYLVAGMPALALALGMLVWLRRRR